MNPSERRSRTCPSPAVILLALLVAPASAEERFPGLVIEAEDFAIPYLPDWTPRKGLGWYAKEHIHASGRAVAICDEMNQGAEMSYALPKPLLPGRYALYVLYYPMHGGGENSLQVTLAAQKGDTRQAIASQPFSWSKMAFYTWAELVFEPKEAFDSIRVKATKVERKSLGDVPDEPYGMIFLDCLFLSGTSGLNLGKYPHRYWPLEWRLEGKPAAQQASASAAPAKSIFGEAKEGENLVRNGGFEAGLLPYWLGWQCERWCTIPPPAGTKERPTSVRLMADSAATALTSENLTSDRPWEGRYALRLGLEKGWMKMERDQYTCGIASFPFPVRDGSVTVSFYAKAAQPGIRYVFGLDDYGPIGTAYPRYFYQAHGRAIGSSGGTFETEWRRHHQPITIKPGVKDAVFWLIGYADAAGRIDIDGVQVELGGPSDYKARPTEVGVLSPVIGRVYYDTEPVKFTVLAASGTERHVKCRFRATNIFREVAEQGSVTIRLSEGHGSQDLALRLATRGSYLFEIWPEGTEGFTSQLAFHIIPPPKARNRTGVICDRANCEAATRFFERVGVRYNGYLWDQQFMGDSCNPEAGKYVWYDELRDRKVRAGIIDVPWVWADQMPKWSRDPSKSPIGINGSNLKWPSPEAYGKFVYDMASHYRGIRRWVIGDELDLQIDPLEYAPYLESALDALKRANPEAKGMPSASPQWCERLYDKIGWDRCHTLGGSYHNAPEGMYWQERELLDRHGKGPPWHLGVGWGCRSLYTFAESEFKASSPFAACVEVARNLSLQYAIVAPEFCTQYTTRYGPPDPFNFFDFDGSFKAQGITYVLVMDFLADAERGDKVVGRVGERVRIVWFTKPDGITAALWGKGELELNIPKGRAELRDMFTNPVSLPRNRRLAMDEKTLWFLQDRGLGKDLFLKTLADAAATFPDDEKCLVLPGAKPGQLDLGVLVRRRRAGNVRVELEPRWLDDRPVSAKDPEGGYARLSPRNLSITGGQANFDLGAGGERLLRFPFYCSWVGRHPLNDLDLGVWITESDGMRKRLRGGWAAKGLWAVSCVRTDAAGTSGARLPWDERLPSFVYASRRLSGNYQDKQARTGSWRVNEIQDSGARLLAAYDPESLHFEIKVTDNDIVNAEGESLASSGDRVELLFDADLLGDIERHTMDRDDVRITIRPGAGDGRRSFPWRAGDGRIGEVSGRLARSADGYTVELDVPWALLGPIERAQAYGIGFDLRLIDADGHPSVKSELVLSGNGDYPWDDPRGWAQLLLMDSPGNYE